MDQTKCFAEQLLFAEQLRFSEDVILLEGSGIAPLHPFLCLQDQQILRVYLEG